MKLFGKWRKETSAPVAEGAAFEASSGKPAANQNSSFGQDRKVLVVDDNPVVLKAFELKLKSLGFQVHSCSDGASAVSAARNEQPDIMILDINFPPDVGSSGLQWNGFTIMQWMHRFKEAANIPVIIITSDDAAKVKDKALAAGAVAFFQKPINQEEFLVTIQRHLSQAAAKSTAA
jgi:CheY-like chemotaxis protein